MKNIMGMDIECDQILKFKDTKQALAAMSMLLDNGIESALLSKNGKDVMNCIQIMSIH